MALEAVKRDYTCRVCEELCKKPVVLKCCAHFICEEHIKDLFKCPTCDIAFSNQPVYEDSNLEACVNSTLELDKIFSQYKTDTNPIDDNKNVTIRATRNAKQLSKNTKDKINRKEARIKSTEIESSKISLQSTATGQKLIKNVEKRNRKGETALHVFCRHGKLEKVQELLNEGANSNTRDHAGWTPLHEAVQSGNLDMVRLLLSHKTLINVPGPDNETPLHEAVRYDHKEIANELVIHGADFDAKNSKGETPILLANSEMKKVLELAMENIIETQTANITNVSSIQTELDYKVIRIYCITQYRTVQNKLKTLVKQHGNVFLETKFNKNVTHLLVDAEDGICLSTLDVLQGIVYGVWIISTEWIITSTDPLEDFEKYEIKGVGTTNCNGNIKSRYNKYKQLPGLFNGCHFYLHNFNTNYEISRTLVLNKTILSKLIIEAGGVVLRRVPNPESIPDHEKLVPYHAKKGGKLDICSHYIIFKDIYEPRYNMKHLKALPIGWLLECIEKYELCEPE